MATSPCVTSPSWPKNVATGPRPGGSGAWSSTRVRATPRPRRAGKHSGKPRRLPQGSAGNETGTQGTKQDAASFSALSIQAAPPFPVHLVAWSGKRPVAEGPKADTVGGEI